jgi:hypothetical protein
MSVISSSRNYQRILAICFLCSTLLVACQTVPPKPIPPRPILSAAPPDTAVLYLFRPELDQVAKSDMPLLLVDSKPLVQFAHATYVRIELAPGRHTVRLEPRDSDSSQWRTAFALDLQSGSNYFAAVWNPKQPAPRGNAVPLMVGSGIFIPIFLDGITRERGGVRIEPVDEDVGTDALRGLTSAGQF